MNNTPHQSSFEYDADNNLKVLKTGTGTTEPVAANISQISNEYTTQGELEKLTESITPPGGGTALTKVSTFKWLRDGVIDAHTVDGQASTFAHRLDRLESEFVPFGGQGEFAATWFDNGDLNQLQMPNGSQLSQAFDGAARLSSREVKLGATIQSKWSDIAYDNNDNRKSELTSQLQPPDDDDDVFTKSGTALYGYDQLDRLISNHHAFDGNDAQVGYRLDNAGNVMSESLLSGSAGDVQGLSLFNFSYTNNRLTSRQPMPSGDALSYGYDASGNQSTETQGTAQPTSNGYDAASHPEKTTNPDGSWAAYTYDGLGRMATRKDSMGEATLFFHFGLKDQIAVEETTKPSADPVTVRYLINSFGAPLGQDSKVGEATSKRSYFVPDLRGNLSQLLGPENDNDEVKGVFAYDPYGKEKKTEDGDSLTRKLQGWDSRLGYQMAPQDKLTGNYNLGPRLLNPNINRFVGADFYAAGAANMALQLDPLTGNRYLYAGANPAGLIDDGHSALSPCLMGVGWCNADDSDQPIKTIGKSVVTFLPGYDCVQLVMDPSFGGGAWCAADFVPVLGKVDNVVDGGKLIVKTAKQAKKTSSIDDLGSAACRTNSFVPGTEVLMADGSTKPIEDGKIGDLVWAEDPKTNEAGARRVTDLIVGDGHKNLVDITIDGDIVTATDQHPFWVDDQGRWIDAQDLESGDLLQLTDGTTVQVEAINERTALQRVHNLTVEGIHTYFVVAGEDAVLVHNCAVLPKPTVSDSRLSNIIDDLYKGTTNPSKVGTGTTADAVRNELKTALPTGGVFHSQKAVEYSRALEKVLKSNLTDHDRIVAHSLRDDPQRALAGQ